VRHEEPVAFIFVVVFFVFFLRHVTARVNDAQLLCASNPRLRGVVQSARATPTDEKGAGAWGGDGFSAGRSRAKADVVGFVISNNKVDMRRKGRRGSDVRATIGAFINTLLPNTRQQPRPIPRFSANLSAPCKADQSEDVVRLTTSLVA